MWITSMGNHGQGYLLSNLIHILLYWKYLLNEYAHGLGYQTYWFGNEIANICPNYKRCYRFVAYTSKVIQSLFNAVHKATIRYLSQYSHMPYGVNRPQWAYVSVLSNTVTAQLSRQYFQNCTALILIKAYTCYIAYQYWRTYHDTNNTCDRGFD